MTSQSDLVQIPLNARSLPPSFIHAGEPNVSGRVLYMSEDKCTALVVWECTPGALSIEPMGSISDVGYLLCGRATITINRGNDEEISAGTLVEFPRSKYVFTAHDTVRKLSFIYSANGLELNVEPPPGG